jgi:hypothetical protein
MASTWNGTEANELISGAALRDGATVTGYYTITLSIPTGDNTKLVTATYIIAHTTAIGGPVSLNQCPTKTTFLSQF